MEKFATILKRAEERKGGSEELNALLPTEVTSEEISQLSDSTILAEMTKKIFQSGFVWRIVEQKWPGFEEVFWGFEPDKLRLASDEQIEKMSQNKKIIRYYTKVKAVRDNAYFVHDESIKHNGFGKFIAEWPEQEITKFWLYLKKHGARLGGNTGPYFLRAIGKDTFLLTRDVTQYLINHGIVDKRPNSIRDLIVVQSVFNEWQQQSARPLAEISRIISCSINS